MQSVKLIGVTKPVGFAVTGEIQTAEDLIAYCARVSNPDNQHNTATASKLLQYCARNKHWSIFEMVNVIMEISTTRDIGRQILRHRSFVFQEFSQRYAEVPVDVDMKRDARWQDQKNRQNSIELSLDDTSYEVGRIWAAKQFALMCNVEETYEWAIKNGIAKEVARAVLPEGLTISRMYMSGSLRSWLHYCQLRMGNGTQKEHRIIAQQCWDIIVKEFPSLKNVLEQQ